MKNSLQHYFVTLAIFISVHQANAAVSFGITPAAISNTYTGTITLQIGGLTNTETVLVRKYLDANGNGVVDAGDLLVQQFQLTDGSASVFHNGGTAVTNFNVPGDLDGAANGQVTAQLYPSLDFVQVFIGKYLFVLSSPVGHFSPQTNSFSVTNFPFGQELTGNVVSNTSPVPNAIVLVIQASGNNSDNKNPVGGVVAANSGAYVIKMPPGTYSLIGFKPNFVANFATAPSITLGAGATIATNVPLTNATESISGKVVDANNSSVGLGGMTLSAQTRDKSLIALAFTDTNGNFTTRVTPNQWGIGGNDRSLALQGYVDLQNRILADTTTGSVSGVTISLPKATAVFYGTVKDTSGRPLPGITAIYSQDRNGNYASDGYTDTNGNYVAPAGGGLSGDQWNVLHDYYNPYYGSAINYIYSQGQYGVTLSSGQAYHYNFTGVPATNSISGNVQFNGGPVSNVGVGANATIGGVQFNTSSDTDSSGNYSLEAANGDWSVNVNCSGGSDSLDNILGSGNYQCPNNQNVTIANNDQTVNFTIQPPGGGSGQIYGYVTDTNFNPIAGVSVYASDGLGDNYSTTTDGNGYYEMNNVAGGSYDVSMDCGQLSTDGYSCQNNDYVNVSGNSVEADFAVQFIGGAPVISAPTHIAAGQFQMTVNGPANQNYTVQMSTNLVSTNWIPLLITNPSSSTFLFSDPNTTNQQRFYRVLVGP